MNDKFAFSATRLTWAQRHGFYIALTIVLTALFYEVYICKRESN